MQFTIFHYHFLPGGVTDVVVLSSRAILQYSKDVSSLVLVSGRSENCDNVYQKIVKGLSRELAEKLEIQVLDELDYSDDSSSTDNDSLVNKLLHRYGGKDSFWWIHNYQLGKNTGFTDAFVRAAVEFNQKTLFHIHDFPECSRYSNLRKLRKAELDLYPQGPAIRYAVINSRDYNYLIQAGLKQETLFLLQNPVSLNPPDTVDNESLRSSLYDRFKGDFPACSPDAPLLFYPVRTIRRKNIFEAGLFARLIPGGANLLVTLPGISDQEIRYSQLVEKAFKEGFIPGYWGIGTLPDDGILSFRNYQAGCDAVFSSSVQEGFGYLYLNSLIWRKPLITRSLDIMGGFRDLFKSDSSLFYEDIYVPLKDKERNELKRMYIQKAEKLVREVPSLNIQGLRDTLDVLFDKEEIDFSYLDPERQYSYLQQIKEDPGLFEACKELNSRTLNKATSILSAQPGNLSEEIQEIFGFEEYNRHIQNIIRSFDNSYDYSVSGSSDKLVNIFSQPGYLRLLYDF